MTTQMIMTDAERTAIEQEVTALYKESMQAMEKVDPRFMASMISDEYHLGFINSTEFIFDAKTCIEYWHKSYDRLERQELLEEIEFNVAVLSPDIVVGTDRDKTAVYRKDGGTFTGYFAHTWVAVRKDGKWRVIHSHQSVQPAEE